MVLWQIARAGEHANEVTPSHDDNAAGHDDTVHPVNLFPF
jgi:hypothetical protein